MFDDEHLTFADIHSPGSVENLKLNPAYRDQRGRLLIVRKGYPVQGAGDPPTRATTCTTAASRCLLSVARRPRANESGLIVIVAVDRAAAVLSTCLRRGGERGRRWPQPGSDTRKRYARAGEARPVSAPPASRHLTRLITGAQATLGSAGPSRFEPVGSCAAPSPPGSNCRRWCRIERTSRGRSTSMNSHWSAAGQPTSSQRPSGDQVGPDQPPAGREQDPAAAAALGDDQPVARADVVEASDLRAVGREGAVPLGRGRRGGLGLEAPVVARVQRRRARPCRRRRWQLPAAVDVGEHVGAERPAAASFESATGPPGRRDGATLRATRRSLSPLPSPAITRRSSPLR